MSDDHQISRRTFIRLAVTSAAVAGAASAIAPIGAFGADAGSNAPIGKMPMRALGKTGRNVCLFSLGGQALLEQPGNRDKAVEIINRAIDLGVNYIDSSADYGRGCSEEYIGEVMATRRKEVYLATKNNSRNYDGAMKELETSLTRLKTDHLDCWQMHNVRTQHDLDQIFAANGVLKALEKARDEKITQFVGITGHYDPFILKTAIERYPFDTILMAINAADRSLPGVGNQYSFIDNLLPTAVEKKMGIIAMKIPARGRMLRPDGVSTMHQAMGYVLTHPVSTVIIGISRISELEENIRIAADFKPFKREEMASIEALAKPYYEEATFFKHM
jgi:predicted aldo/keto reductase-like oxidoreductase